MLASLYLLTTRFVLPESTSKQSSSMVKIPFLIWVCFIFTSSSVVSQQVEFYYENFHEGNTSLSLSGVAEIEKNGMLRLTNHTSRLIGHAFYPFPIKFKSSNDSEAFSFSTAFAFAIVPQYRALGGHGFAFTISQSEDFSQALPSQYLGLLNDKDNGNFTNHVFAVEFDTVKDFEFADINDNHIGIDINSMVSNKSVPAAYFINNGSGLTTQNLHLQSGETIQAWIDYDSDRKELNVTLSLSSTKPALSLLTYQLDLSRILKENMYVGFSASTGLLASSHYVFGWSFNMSGIARSLDLSSLPSLLGHGKDHTGLVIGLSVLFVVLVLVSVGTVAYFVRRKKNADVVEDWELDVGPRRFSYQELKTATNGFKESELLGFGGFGRVYKGVLSDSNTEVAVKRISHESRQGLREFASEITTIGRLRHKNLVQLLGWCRRKEDLLIVYDFMPNGSLDKYLFDEPQKILTWEQRFKIIRGAASGLLYLHEEWEQTVIHRDIKAGNVLLDSELNSRLGDFGLAKLYEHGSNPSSTKVVGTLGYLAPELTRTGKPTTASDVFAFGAVLLEVVCGRRPVEPKALPEELILVDWIWEKWSAQSILDVVDKRLNGEYDEVEVVMVLKLGLMCSNNAPQVRPTIRQVVRYLEGEIILPEVLAPLDACEMIKGDNSGSHSTAFEDFMCSYPSSSGFEKASTLFEGDADAEAASTLSLSGSGGGR